MIIRRIQTCIRIGRTKTQLAHVKTMIDQRINRFKGNCQTEIDNFGSEDTTPKEAVTEGCFGILLSGID